jgi:NADH dehydrogenase
MAFGTRTATIFGGGGFIGRHLVKRLAAGGTVVRVPSRHVSRLGYLRTTGMVGQIVPEIVDVAVDLELEGAMRGSDVVVNLIGILAERRPGDFDRIHRELAERIANIAGAAGVKRLVHVSALGAAVDGLSAYARSKAAGERAVSAVFPQATILRPSIVFGPEDGFFNRFAAMARISPVLPLIGGGRTRFQPVYVGDVADAAMAALDRADAPGRTYELGGPGIYSFRALMELMLAEIDRKRALVTVPWGLARLQGSLLERLPAPPLTRDQVESLKTDNVLSGELAGLDALGVTPTAAELILPTYLDRFRAGGRFNVRGRAIP